MNTVLAEIKRGQHPLMLDYVEFSFDEQLMRGGLVRQETISPTHYSPLRVRYDESGNQIHDGWVCSQSFYDYKTWEDFASHYMRIVRCGNPDYLNYSMLSHDPPIALKDFEHICSICDNEFTGVKFQCFERKCKWKMTDVCLGCYDTHKNCDLCGQLLQNNYAFV